MTAQSALSILPIYIFIGLQIAFALPLEPETEVLHGRASVDPPSTCPPQDFHFSNISTPSLTQLNVNSLQNNSLVIFSNCTKTVCASSESSPSNSFDTENSASRNLLKRQVGNESTWAIIHQPSSAVGQSNRTGDQPSASSSTEQSTWGIYHGNLPSNISINGSTAIDNPLYHGPLPTNTTINGSTAIVNPNMPGLTDSNSNLFYDPGFSDRYKKQRNIYLIRSIDRNTGRVELRFLHSPTVDEDSRILKMHKPENAEWVVDHWFEPSFVSSFLVELQGRSETIAPDSNAIDKFFKCASSPENDFYMAMNSVTVNGIGVDSRMALLRHDFLGMRGSITPIYSDNPTTPEVEALVSYLELGQEPFYHILTSVKDYLNKEIGVNDKMHVFAPGDLLEQKYRSLYESALQRAEELVRHRLRAAKIRPNPKIQLARTKGELGPDAIYVYSNGVFVPYEEANPDTILVFSNGAFRPYRPS